jgi:hypothetical protein
MKTLLLVLLLCGSLQAQCSNQYPLQHEGTCRAPSAQVDVSKDHKIGLTAIKRDGIVALTCYDVQRSTVILLGFDGRPLTLKCFIDEIGEQYWRFYAAPECIICIRPPDGCYLDGVFYPGCDGGWPMPGFWDCPRLLGRAGCQLNALPMCAGGSTASNEPCTPAGYGFEPKTAAIPDLTKPSSKPNKQTHCTSHPYSHQATCEREK